MSTLVKRIVLINVAVLVVILLLALTVGASLAQGPTPGNAENGFFGWGRGPGMMGGWRGQGGWMMQGWGQGFGQTGVVTGTGACPCGYGPMGGWQGIGRGWMRSWQGSSDQTTGPTGILPFGYGPGGRMGRGMMGGWGNNVAPWGGEAAEMTVTEAQARDYAQKFLETNFPGVTLGDQVDTFYGHYSVPVLRDGQVIGFLNVNGYTGQVWYPRGRMGLGGVRNNSAVN